MADEREPEREQKEIAPLTADEVASREFATTFRGYEPTDVRTFLERVAARLRATEEQSQGLRARLDRLQARVTAVEAEAARTPPPAAMAAAALPDEATLLGALGEQAAHILRTAHEGADAITKRAEEVARETVTVAEAEANRMKLQAEAILSSRVRDADAEAVTIVRQAKEDAERIRVSATAEAGRIVDEGRVRGREIVDEAQGVRERVLGDLMKRRRVAQVQIEQLRAGRERLLEAYRVVRRTLEDVTDELQRADAEARGAAEAAGRRLAGEPGRSLPNLGRSGSGSGSGGGSGSATSAGGGGSLSGPTSPSRSASPARSSAPAPDRSRGGASRPVASAGRGGAAALEAVEPMESAEPAAPVEFVVDDEAEQPTVRVVGSSRPAPRRSALPQATPRVAAESVRIIREVPPEPEPQPEPEVAPDDEAETADDEASSEADAPAFPGMDDSAAELARLEEALDAHRVEADAADEADGGLLDDEDEPVLPPPGGWPPGPRFQPHLDDDLLAPSEEAAPDANLIDAVEVEAAGEGAAESVDQPAGEDAAEETADPVAEQAEPPEAAAEPEPPRQVEASPATTEVPASAGTTEGSGASATKARRADIDQLFARIRAEREEAVAKAHEVLDEPATAPAAPTAGPSERAEAADSPSPVMANDHEAVLQRRDVAIDPVLDQMTRKLKRALQDEQNDLLDRLRNLRGRASAETLLLSPQTQAERFRVAALTFLGEAAAGGVAFYDGATDEPVAVQDLAENLAFSIVGPLRRRLEAALDDGHGDDAGTVAEQVGSAYREWKTQRIEQVAGDHVIAAFSRGVLAGAGSRSSWTWVVDDQGVPCPDCDDNSLAGAVSGGESFPTGQLHPPAHTGCRCLLVPAG